MTALASVALMDIAIGCRFEFEVATPTHAVVMVEPHPDEASRVGRRGALVDPGRSPRAPYRDLFENRCRRMTLPAGLVELVYRASSPTTAGPTTSMPDAPELAPAEPPRRRAAVPAAEPLLPVRRAGAPFAFEQFGTSPPGWTRVQAISEWVHDHIAVRLRQGVAVVHGRRRARPAGTACAATSPTSRVALCRALNIPTRYVFGYLPDIGVPDPGVPMDFCAWLEV